MVTKDQIIKELKEELSTANGVIAFQKQMIMKLEKQLQTLKRKSKIFDNLVK